MDFKIHLQPLFSYPGGPSQCFLRLKMPKKDLFKKQCVNWGLLENAKVSVKFLRLLSILSQLF